MSLAHAKTCTKDALKMRGESGEFAETPAVAILRGKSYFAGDDELSG